MKLLNMSYCVTGMLTKTPTHPVRKTFWMGWIFLCFDVWLPTSRVEMIIKALADFEQKCGQGVAAWELVARIPC